MLKIAVGGLKKEVTEKVIRDNFNDEVLVTKTTDFDGAKKLKNKEIDYYIGACNSGGGAAISILIGIVGYNNCVTVAKAGKKPKEEDIIKVANQNKKAFGVSVENIEYVVPILVRELIKNHR